MGWTRRTRPSSCPQLYNTPSACPRVSPLPCAVSQLLPVMLGTWRGYGSPFLLRLLLICQDRWASLQNFKSSACQEDKAREVKRKENLELLKTDWSWNNQGLLPVHKILAPHTYLLKNYVPVYLLQFADVSSFCRVLKFCLRRGNRW